MLKGFDYSYFLLIIPILRMNWAVLQYRYPASIVIPFILLWFFCVFLRQDRKLIPFVQLNGYYRLTIFAVVLYILLPLFYGIFDPNNRLSFRLIGAIGRFLEFFTMFSIVHITLITGKIRELKFCTLLCLFTVFWNGLAVLRGGSQLASSGGGARLITAINQQAQKSGAYYQDVDMALSLGVGNAESAYVSAFLFPLLIFSCFNIKGWLKKSILVVLAFCSYLNLKYSGLNTPIMIAIVGCVLTLLVKFKKRALLLWVGAAFALFMVAFSFNPKIMSFMATPLTLIADATEDLPYIHERCVSMIEAVGGTKDTYAAQRYELQQISARQFVSGNILFGVLFSDDKRRGGGHSEFLDALATYGLVGAFVICLFWYAFVRYSRRLADVSLGVRWLYMSYIYAGAWFFSSIVNPAVLGSPVIILLIPGLAVYYNEFEERWGLK